MRPIFKNYNPGYLLVSETPLVPNGNIKSLNLNEINEKFNFDYDENIFLPEFVDDIKFGHATEREFILKKIKERLKNPLNEKLVVCFIDDSVGYGVFTKEFIAAGTIIGLYAGQVDSPYGHPEDYGMAFPPNFRVNARHVGGITRFIQHMPYSFDKIGSEINSCPDIDTAVRLIDANGIFFSDQNDLIKIDYMRKSGLDNQLKQFATDQISALRDTTKAEQAEMAAKSFLRNIPDLATANVRQYLIQYKDRPVLYFQTLYDIHPGEQLGVSYGLSYWDTRGHSPRYFDKQGRVIPTEDYLPSLESIVKRHQKADAFYLPTVDTALRRASAKGHRQDVEFLLEYGAKVNAADENLAVRRTALHWAAERKHADVVDLLIQRGAERHIPDAQNKTAVDCNPSIFMVEAMAQIDLGL